MKRKSFLHAGEILKIKETVPKFGGMNFKAEDYWENVSGKSWMDSNGNAAAIFYAIRTGTQIFKVPVDDEVVYGKIGQMGYLFHVSELELPKATIKIREERLMEKVVQEKNLQRR